MLLPPDFSFSQHNLQDYVDCPRRFFLKYVQNVAWPAIQSEPVLEMEKRIELGTAFHRAIHQVYLGIDPSVIEAQCDDVELAIWLRNFLAEPSLRDFKIWFPETTLTTSLNGFRLIAKFDLIGITRDDESQIWDWKTSRRKPSHSVLQARIQTRLYPFVFCSSQKALSAKIGINPSQLSMVYWFADFPSEPERFDYSDARLEVDRRFLESLLDRITSSNPEEFTKTENQKMCRFCVYRSLCERGKEAGNWDELEDLETSDDLIGFSFLDAGEIAF